MRRRAQITHFKTQLNGIISPDSPKSSPKSPLSPVGRVAKRNAKLLNGLDLNNVANRHGYSEAVVGTLPDIAPFDYLEECPTFSRLIDEDNEDETLQIEELNSLQYEIEKILTNNIDRQKWLHGESTFLNTGDYPTDDLADRLLPQYKIRGHFYHDFSQPSCSKNFPIEDGMSDFGSSPDEDAHHRVSILDIPQRFWSWTREYLQKIDDSFVRNWMENLVTRFDPENIKKYYVNEPFKYRKKCAKKEEDEVEEKPSKRLNGSYVAVSSSLPTKLRLKRRISEDLNGNTKQLKLDLSPIDKNGKKGDSALTPLVENMVDAFLMESLKNTSYAFASLSRQNSIVNGTNGFHEDKNLNGFHEKNESGNAVDRSIFDDLGEALTKHLINKGVLPESSEFLVKTLAKESLNEVKVKISREGMKSTDDETELDDVSQELLSKQNELAQVEATTGALISCAFERIKGEYVMHELGKKLDKADIEVLQLANQFTSESSFVIPQLTAEQRSKLENALEKRNFAYRMYDHKTMADKPTYFKVEK